MRRETHSLDVPNGNGAGAAQNVADLSQKWTQVLAADAVLDLEGTIDGSTWVAVASVGPNATEVVEVRPAFAEVRVVVSLSRRRTSTAVLAGRDARSR